MKKYILILFLFLSINTIGQEQPPTYSFQSTSHYIHSDLSQNVTVYEVGAYSPSQPHGPYRSGTGGFNPGYDPGEPSSPIGDPVLPLILCVLIYIVGVSFKNLFKARLF